MAINCKISKQKLILCEMNLYLSIKMYLYTKIYVDISILEIDNSSWMKYYYCETAIVNCVELILTVFYQSRLLVAFASA
jgi:hypothetical protein